MAPAKFDKSDPEVASLISLFQSTGFTEARAIEACKNAKNASALRDLIQQNNLPERKVDDKKASLLSHLAIKAATLDNPGKSYIVEAILDARLKSADQVSGTLFRFYLCLLTLTRSSKLQ